MRKSWARKAPRCTRRVACPSPASMPTSPARSRSRSRRRTWTARSSRRRPRARRRPRWGGAAPIQRAILAGDAESGVDLMRMEAGLDTGPVLLERRTPIGPDETGGTLHDRLSALGAEVFAEGLRRALDRK